MTVHLKSPDEIEKMRVAGRLASEVLDYITPFVKPGGTTDTTSGIGLAAGETLGPLGVENLNKLYLIGDNAGDDLSYLILK